MLNEIWRWTKIILACPFLFGMLAWQFLFDKYTSLTTKFVSLLLLIPLLPFALITFAYIYFDEKVYDIQMRLKGKGNWL